MINVYPNVLKQDTSSDNDTALYIMNPMIEFYSNILAYLDADSELPNYRKPFVGPTERISEILRLSEIVHPSWETTEESLDFLKKCICHASLVSDDEWSSTLNDFTKCGFRDLTVLKNPAAMDLFDKLARTILPTFNNGEDMFIWAKSIKERPDGSGVIVLHVSDLERFRKEIERHDLVDDSTNLYTLEGGDTVWILTLNRSG